MNYDRPKLKITPSRLDIFLDISAYAVLVFIWVYILLQYADLPDIISIHFNLKGEADNYGSKASIFILPFIISMIIIGLTILNRFPYLFNYPRQITESNAREEYAKASRLIRIIKLIVIVFITIIMVNMVNGAKQGFSSFPIWLIPIFVISMILPILMYLFKPNKNNRNKQNESTPLR